MKKTYFCCEDISKIENYDLALKDNFKDWDYNKHFTAEIRKRISDAVKSSKLKKSLS